MHYIFQKLRCEFFRYVFVLAGGTAIAQVIVLIGMPMLSRLYGPEAFGIYALFFAIVPLLSHAFGGTYELAINLPQDNKDAFALLGLVIARATICYGISMAAIGSVQRIWPQWIASTEIGPWLYWLAFTTWMWAVIQGLIYWFNRSKDYRRLAINRVIGAIFNILISIIIALLWPYEGGLIFGYIGGACIMLVILSIALLQGRHPGWEHLSPAKINAVRLRYIAFPRYNIMSRWATTLSLIAPIFFLNHYFGPATAGFYSLTQRCLGGPVALVADSLLDVFKQRANDDYHRQGHCREIYDKLFIGLSAIAFPPFLIMIAWGPIIFACIFGQQWQQAGDFAQILAALHLTRFIVWPLCYTYIMAEKQRENFLVQTTISVGSIIGLWIGMQFLKSIYWGLTLYTASYVIVYCIALIRSRIFTQRQKIEEAMLTQSISP